MKFYTYTFALYYRLCTLGNELKLDPKFSAVCLITLLDFLTIGFIVFGAEKYLGLELPKKIPIYFFQGSGAIIFLFNYLYFRSEKNFNEGLMALKKTPKKKIIRNYFFLAMANILALASMMFVISARQHG